MAARVGNRKEAVDNESLIRLVKERPCLYDKRDPFYKDQIKRDNAWLDISRLTFKDWGILSETDCTAKSK